MSRQSKVWPFISSLELGNATPLREGSMPALITTHIRLRTSPILSSRRNWSPSSEPRISRRSCENVSRLIPCSRPAPGEGSGARCAARRDEAGSLTLLNPAPVRRECITLGGAIEKQSHLTSTEDARDSGTREVNEKYGTLGFMRRNPESLLCRLLCADPTVEHGSSSVRMR